MALSQPGTRGVRDTAAAYAALVRVPNLFTAPPDVIAGAALAVTAGAHLSTTAVTGVAVVSMLLYAGGTTLNDYFDAPVDATERPERPIPAGHVARPVAGILGVTFLVGAVLTAAIIAGTDAGIAAGAVALAVVVYDGILKGGPAGFLAMGIARGLNVLLGTTATTASLSSLPSWTLAIPVVVTAYIAGVTYVAAAEATGVDRRAVVVAGVGAATAGLGAVALLVTVGFDADSVALLVAIALAGGFLLVTGRALRRAYRDPSPETVGPVVGTCVLALVVFDAAVAGIAGLGWTLTAVAFLVPATLLSRFFDIS